MAAEPTAGLDVDAESDAKASVSNDQSPSLVNTKSVRFKDVSDDSDNAGTAETPDAQHLSQATSGQFSRGHVPLPGELTHQRYPAAVDACNGHHINDPLHAQIPKLGPQQAVRLSILLAVIGYAVLIVLSVLGHIEEDSPDNSAAPADFVANDLWAVHDLLLVGYAAPFMKPGSDGERTVRASAVELARLLPLLHPYKPCRQQVGVALTGNPGMGDLDVVAAAADASWACLPAKFSATDFMQPVSAKHMHARSGLVHLKSTAPLSPKSMQLGACRLSSWPRTCSYWAVLHGMALQADHSGKSWEFLKAVANVISGGVTMCSSCNMHFVLLMEGLVHDSIRQDVTSGFCANEQCSHAGLHVRRLMRCVLEHRPDDCTEIQGEVDDATALRAALSGSFGTTPFPASAVLVALHNMVTASISSKFTGPRHRFFCLGEVIRDFPASLSFEKQSADANGVELLYGPAGVLPGLADHHQLIDCFSWNRSSTKVMV